MHEANKSQNVISHYRIVSKIGAGEMARCIAVHLSTLWVYAP